MSLSSLQKIQNLKTEVVIAHLFLEGAPETAIQNLEIPNKHVLYPSDKVTKYASVSSYDLDSARNSLIRFCVDNGIDSLIMVNQNCVLPYKGVLKLLQSLEDYEGVISAYTVSDNNARSLAYSESKGVLKRLPPRPTGVYKADWMAPVNVVAIPIKALSKKKKELRPFQSVVDGETFKADSSIGFIDGFKDLGLSVYLDTSVKPLFFDTATGCVGSPAGVDLRDYRFGYYL